MPDKPWKAFERNIAARFSTTRTPLSGGTSQHTRSDTLHPTLFIEAKHRRAWAPLLRAFAEQVPKAHQEGKVSVLILGVPRLATEQALVICRLGDLPYLADQMRRAS